MNRVVAEFKNLWEQKKESSNTVESEMANSLNPTEVLVLLMGWAEKYKDYSKMVSVSSYFETKFEILTA
jgi:hypothetical protein